MPGEIGFDVPELVVSGLKSFGMSANVDASVPILRRFFMTNRVLTEYQVMVVAANDDGRTLSFVTGTVVQDHIALEAIPMSSCIDLFLAKLDSRLGVGDDAIANNRVVRAPATDGDTWAGVFHEPVILEAAALDDGAYE